MGSDESRPRCLFSYLQRPITWDISDPRLMGHSNRWESRETARLIMARGFGLDAISFNDPRFVPKHRYELFFDIHGNMQRLAPRMPEARKLMHITGSYPRFQNASEERWAREFEERTGVAYKPKRAIKDLDEFDRSMYIADRCSLIGNERTLTSFPEEVRGKIATVTVSASQTYIKPPSALLPSAREFVWFFGTGAVHKGLDRCLEAFNRMPGRVLHVFGHVDWEEDFMAAYGPQLLKSGNVRYHGRMEPTSPGFKDILGRCFAFIAPSCSEGISPAAATMMQAGLYPIVSRETGITLPDGCGTYLERCEIDEIVQACDNATLMSDKDLLRDITTCQSTALMAYSRCSFTTDMERYLAGCLDKTNN